MKISHSLLFTVAMLSAFPFLAMNVYAQTMFPVEYRQNGENIKGAILGNHEWYEANNNCLYHRTSMNNSFAHVHVDVPSPLEAYVQVPNLYTGKLEWKYKGPFTMSDVDAYWDWWFDSGADGRGNMANISNSGGENLRQNCWGYSLGYGTWVNDPAPIYRDDFTRLANQDWPSPGDVIRVRNTVGKDSHVVTIYGTDYQAYYNVIVVAGTIEKFRHSGIYVVIYGWDFCTLEDYWRKN